MTVFNVDCLDGMRWFPDATFDAIVCDPPYELGFMGKAWDSTGIANSVELWREALRVLKPGGHLLAFSGTRTYHRMTCAIEDAGFEIRDQIGWLYGTGFPKGQNLSGDWQGWGTALKPAWEPICVARKPLVGTVAANVLAHGTGAINIDACRVGWPDGAIPQIGTPEWGGPSKKLTSAPGQDGDTVERAAPSPLGRWPANVIHDGSDEVLAAFPNAPGALAPVTGDEPSASTANTFGKYERRGTSPGRRETDKSAARFFYCAKASKADRDAGLENFDAVHRANGNKWTDQDYRVERGERPASAESGPRKNIHPTVKPSDLMRYLCRLVTPPGGCVLDPFAGSGSTGKAAKLEGFAFIGFELDATYAAIANARIDAA